MMRLAIDPHYTCGWPYVTNLFWTRVMQVPNPPRWVRRHRRAARIPASGDADQPGSARLNGPLEGVVSCQSRRKILHPCGADGMTTATTNCKSSKFFLWHVACSSPRTNDGSLFHNEDESESNEISYQAVSSDSNNSDGRLDEQRLRDVPVVRGHGCRHLHCQYHRYHSADHYKDPPGHGTGRWHHDAGDLRTRRARYRK